MPTLTRSRSPRNSPVTAAANPAARNDVPRVVNAASHVRTSGPPSAWVPIYGQESGRATEPAAVLLDLRQWELLHDPGQHPLGGFVTHQCLRRGQQPLRKHRLRPRAPAIGAPEVPALERGAGE